MIISSFYIEPAHYKVDFEDLRSVRVAVFVVEQQIPPEIEFDELDRYCHHLLARDSQYQPIGTARLSPEGKIGRMAVLSEWRSQGIGEALLRALIDKARNLGLTKLTAHAQLTALSFYEKFGFVTQGETFTEAGIAHQAISLLLQPPSQSARPLPIQRDPSVPAIKLDTFESTFSATLQLIRQSRRQLYIFSHDLEYKLYGHNEMVEALKQFVLGHRNSGVQIIIQDPIMLRSQSHPVLELAQRLSSHFVIRTPVEIEDIQYLSTYVINDSGGYLFSQLANRFERQWSPNLPARNRQLREEFDRVWQRSRPCTEFRALGL
jgi:predicted GNAT family N-acyltransferase